ncbi:MAG: cobalamin biosynthesis protein [Mycolicibacterium sp.]|nr:cobalamin biosynthesis protein [Mycolicibacterium sp.]
MFARRTWAPAAGIVAGYCADLVIADPRRGHPVALFGGAAAALERVTYRDARWAGALHAGVLLGSLAIGGIAIARAAAAAALAPAIWAALGGTSLARAGTAMAGSLAHGDIAAARSLLPSLCGRDPDVLDAGGLTRASVESIAENTSDAHVAPLLWAALGGVPAVLLYRGVNTLDAMIAHRSPRYRHFGWAAARLDDYANFIPARVTGTLVALCAPVVGGSPAAALRAWRRDAARHPSPNAGVVEAAFAGALGVRLGGPTQYAHGLEIRPSLGDGPAPLVSDLKRAIRLSRTVQVAAVALSVALSVALATISAAARSGRPASPRW